jgi:4-hydroxy-2-oxoheptanedioate aldolase
VVILQIETVGSLAQLDEIVQLEGLDGLVVGPYDLSGSMGHMGQIDHPDVLAAIEKVSTTAHAAGLSVGVGMAAEASHAERAFSLGADWVQCGNDFEYMIRFADQLKEQVLG